MGVFKIGERVKVVGTTSGSGIPIGTTSNVVAYVGQFVRLAAYPHSNLYEVDVESMPYKLADAEKAFHESEKDYVRDKERLNYMKENNIEELSDDAFRIHVLTKVMNDANLPMEEKVKTINAIYAN